MPLLIGGFLPALLIGFALTFLKLSSQSGVGAGTGMIITGVGVTVAGVIAHLLGLSGIGSLKSIPFSFFVGLFWGAGSLLMAYAVSKLGLPMTISASLAATNIVIVALLGILFLGEGSNISMIKLIIGITAIVVGSFFVTTA